MPEPQDLVDLYDRLRQQPPLCGRRGCTRPRTHLIEIGIGQPRLGAAWTGVHRQVVACGEHVDGWEAWAAERGLPFRATEVEAPEPAPAAAPAPVVAPRQPTAYEQQTLI